MSSVRRMLGQLGLLLSTGLLAVTAHATTLYTNDISVTADDSTQLGRLSRNGLAQDWSGGEAYPGVINTGTSYHYRTVTLDLDALYDGLGLQFGSYIQINFDSTSANTFLAAYLDTYNPVDKALNWLGDVGTSANFFPGDPQYFQVIVPTGHDLVLLLNDTTTNGAGLNQIGTLLVEGFTDTEFTDPATRQVPEPGVAALLLVAGIGACAGRRRALRTSLVSASVAA